MRAANTAIKRVCHPIPTVRDISLDLNGAKYFTKLDMSQAYHQLELSTPSRNITTFTTHAGLYRFKRLNYGTNSAAEMFQNTLQQILYGIKGSVTLLMTFSCLAQRMRNIIELSQNAYNAWKFMV